MRKNKICGKYGQIHFVGILGVSMSGLAKFCLRKGAGVSGSDKASGDEAEKLKKCGARVFGEHAEKNVGKADLVVYTSAADDRNPEILKAKELGIKCMKRSEFLGAIMSEFGRSVAVAGSHGKTTTTAMLWEIFVRADKDPTVFVGGNYGEKGNFRYGEGNVVITEACEYKKNFLDLKPDLAVVLNIDNDHLDSFESFEGEVSAFGAFVRDCVAVLNADDENASRLSVNSVTFGIKNPAVYMAKNIRKVSDGYSFVFYAYGKRIGKITLKIIGKHNIYNALAAAAVADMSGIPFSVTAEALGSFCGVQRRNEYLGVLCGLPVFADYAHHPAELAATLSAYAENGKNPIVVFQPHTYSRTRILMADFLRVLGSREKVIIYKTFPARERYDEAGDGMTLAENLKKLTHCEYADDDAVLVRKIEAFADVSDCVLILGAGDVYDIAKNCCINIVEEKNNL